MTRLMFLAAVGVTVFFTTVSPLRAGILLDDFNRPDSTNMGPNWNEVSADFQIVSGRARGSGLGSMIYVGQTSNSVTADVFATNSGSDYGAIVLGFADSTRSLYIKLQS